MLARRKSPRLAKSGGHKALSAKKLADFRDNLTKLQNADAEKQKQHDKVENDLKTLRSEQEEVNAKLESDIQGLKSSHKDLNATVSKVSSKQHNDATNTQQKLANLDTVLTG